MLALLPNMQKHTAWLLASAVLIACGSPGIVEKHRIKGSEMLAQRSDLDVDAAAADGGEDEAPPGPCPAGFTCMDIAALGVMATDGDGKPVTASCSMGAPTTCDDADPASSCEGLSKPFCAHLKLGAQDIVSCAQRCTP